MPASSPSGLDALAARRLVVVTGKGGVGKSAVSAALGQALSQRRRVLVLEVDPRENVHQMLGLPPSGGEIVAAAPNLWLQNLKPRQVLDEIIREQVRIGLIARRVLRSPIYHQLAEGMPGLEELAVVSHALRLTGPKADPSFDLVVLDAPATGHGVTLLAAPLLVSEVISKGPIGRLAAELSGLVADAERCGIVVVTLAEEMPVQEALELRQMLHQRLDREAELLVVNGLYPRLPAAVADEGDGADAALSLWRRRRKVNERELGRLDQHWQGERRLLPLLPLDRGPELVAALAGELGGEGA
jgi:anion-transporting  ArsA/GET3 family ATPase